MRALLPMNALAESPTLWRSAPTHAGEWLVKDQEGTIWTALVNERLMAVVHGSSCDYNHAITYLIAGMAEWRPMPLGFRGPTPAVAVPVREHRNSRCDGGRQISSPHTTSVLPGEPSAEGWE
jgi:hypothetical protein